MGHQEVRAEAEGGKRHPGLRGSLQVGMMWYSLGVVSRHCLGGWVWGHWGSGMGLRTVLESLVVLGWGLGLLVQAWGCFEVLGL